MKLKDIASTITAGAAAAAVVGGVIYSTGWVIDRAGAEEIAQQKANEVFKELQAVQRQIYEELKQDDEDRLSADIEILKLQIEGMSSKPNRSEYENVQLRIWNQQLTIKQQELAALTAAKEQPVP